MKNIIENLSTGGREEEERIRRCIEVIGKYVRFGESDRALGWIVTLLQVVKNVDRLSEIDEIINRLYEVI